MTLLVRLLKLFDHVKHSGANNIQHIFKQLANQCPNKHSTQLRRSFPTDNNLNIGNIDLYIACQFKIVHSAARQRLQMFNLPFCMSHPDRIQETPLSRSKFMSLLASSFHHFPTAFTLFHYATHWMHQFAHEKHCFVYITQQWFNLVFFKMIVIAFEII